MFLLYYVWGLFIFIIYNLKNVIETLYIEFNHPMIIFKREFKDLSYFEKLFLVFFYRDGWFKNSIANIFDLKSIFEYRKNNYPLIFFYHMYYNRVNNKLTNLLLLTKQYNYFNESNIFKTKLSHFNNFFFKTHFNFKNFIILQKILYKRYFNLCSSIYFNNNSNLNNLKLNWLFHIFLLRSKGKLVIYDLYKYSDWYEYNFIVSDKQLDWSKILVKDKLILLKNVKTNKNIKFLKTINTYNNNVSKFFNKVNLKYKNIFLSKIIFNHINKISINEVWNQKLIKYFPIRFSESSVTKHVNYSNFKNFGFFYLRKNKIFNKGRYSRNRQLYRTGVYWCLWLNILIVYGLYFLFYRFMFNFGYIWWGLLILLYTTIFSRILKYHYYNIYYLVIELINFIQWIGFLILELKFCFENFFNKYFYKYNEKNYFFNFKSYKYNYLFNKIIIYLYKFYFKYIDATKSQKFIFFWEGMKDKDTSIFKYKTFLYWIKQFYRMLFI